jgi:hypothetical protein
VRRTVLALAVALVGATAQAAPAKPTVTPADRAAINRVLDAFVPAAIGRRHAERAWALASPTMHLGGTKAEWARGSLPVTPFPVLGTTFHGWKADWVVGSQADIVLLVHLRKGAPLGAVSFDIRMRKLRGRWLVDSAAPEATFAASGQDSRIEAQPDFRPQPGQAFSKTGRVSAKWALIIPGIFLGILLVTPIVVIGLHRLGDRRVRKARAESDRDRVFRNLGERPH